jgi:hypothetical protein
MKSQKKYFSIMKITRKKEGSSKAKEKYEKEK